MTIIHKLIVLKVCTLSLAAFFLVGTAHGADYFQVVTKHANIETVGDSFSVSLVARNTGGGTDTSYTGDHNITWILEATVKNSPDGWTPIMPNNGIQSFEQGVATATGFILPNAGTCTLSASDGTVRGTATITIKPGIATQFKFATPATNMTGQAFSLSFLKACDLYGNVATDYYGNKSLSYSGPGTATRNPAYPGIVTFDHGIANLPLRVTLYKAEETRIHIEDGAVRGDSGTITVSPGTYHHFEVITANNQTEQAGIPFSVTIRARDLYGNLATGYEGDFAINCTCTANSSPSGTKPDKPEDGTYTFTNGAAVIPGFILTNAAETPTISVTDGLISGESTRITVNPGTAAMFKVATEHDNIETANTTFRVILACQDLYENTLTNFSGSYSTIWQWTAHNSPSGKTPIKPADGWCGFTNGIAAIDGFTLTNAGETPCITARSSAISGTSSPVTIKSGEAVTLQFNAPVTVNAGQSFLLSPIIAYDYCGNIAASYQGQKSLNYSGAACGPVSGTPSFTTQVYFSNGSSTTELKTTLIRAGTSSIQVNDGKITGMSETITIMAGNAAIFSLITQHNGTEKAGIPFGISIVASDIFGNFASGYEGNQYLTWTWAAINSPDNIQPRLPGNGNQSFINGSVTVAGITLFNAQETPVIAVSDGNIRGTSSQIVVQPTSVTHFEMTTQHNQAEIAGATFSVSLTARDSCGNIATNYIGNKDLRWGLNATSSPTNVLPKKPDDGPQVFNQGRVEVGGFRLVCAEEMATITVTESTVTGTRGQIMVRSGTQAVFSIDVPVSVTVNQMFAIGSIAAQDACGNIALNYQGVKTLTYTGPDNSPSGIPPSYTNPVNFVKGIASKLFTTLVKAETTAIRVQEGGINGESAKIEVTPSLTSRFEIVTKNNDTETAGKPFSVILRVLDVYNNLDTSYTGSHRIKWQWNATRSANDSLPSIAQEGDCIFINGVSVEVSGFRLVNADEIPTIIARDGSIEGSSKPIIVTAGTPTSFEIITPSYVKAGELFNITKITAKDDYGNVAKGYTGDKSLTYSGPGNGLLKGIPSYTRVVNFDKGISTTVLKTTLYRAERVRIHAEEGAGISGSGIFGDSREVEVRGAGEAVFQVATQHDNEETAGEAFSVIIRTMDEFGNAVSSYEHVHYLVWTWTAAASPGGVMSDRPLNGNADFEYGVATIQGFRLTNATQTPTISVADGNVRGTSAAIRVKPNKAVSFDISVPSPVTVNRPFNISRVIAKDAFGNIDVSYSGDKILLYTGPSSDAANGDPGYTYAAHFEAGILTTPLATILSKEELTAITISEGNVVGTSNGIEVLTMGACFLINPHEVYASTTQIMNCQITNNNSANIDRIQLIIPYGFTFVALSVPQCSDKNKVWNAKPNGQEIVLIPATVSDCLLNGESIQIEITVKVMGQEQISVPWPCMITSGSFTLRAIESKEGDGQVRITAYRLEADAFPKERVILMGGTATIIASLAEFATSKPYFNGLVEFSVVFGTENAVLLGDPKVYTNPSGLATINLKSGTSTGTVTVQMKYREYDIKTVNIRIVSNVPKIIPGKGGFIKQNEVIVKPITPVSLVSEEGFSLKYRIDDGTWTTYTSPFEVGTPGVHTIDYTCVDAMGNPGPIMSSPLFVMPEMLGELINYPNPFSSGKDGFTTIEYYLDVPMDVEIRIYNLLGELVRNMDVPSDKAGTQQVRWDGRNGSGDIVGNGGYICVVRVKDQEKGMRRKILVVK
ncbi:MAG: FlgD immunoglobulin-like domain containing protein [bacterium]